MLDSLPYNTIVLLVLFDSCHCLFTVLSGCSKVFVTFCCCSCCCLHERPTACPVDSFKCQDLKECVAIKKLCDGEDDCEDGSDEWFCHGGS